jgi:transposase InsO family protein
MSRYLDKIEIAVFSGIVNNVDLMLRVDLLNGELVYSLAEAQFVIGIWRRHYNTKRPHSSLGYKPPAP